jgi:NADH-quinone oxidoreductase subunit E
MSEELAGVKEIIDKWGTASDILIEILHDLQSKFNYLPGEALVEVANMLNVPLGQIYHVATFYKAFSLVPKGKHRIHVCMGTPCHVKGAPALVEALERHLKIKLGGTTEDREFSLDTCGCVGTCGLAPILIVGEDMHGNVTQSKIRTILKKYKK